MARDEDGWWRPGRSTARRRRGGVRLRLPAGRPGTVLPDPRSRWQPDGVHGWSRTFDPDAFNWTDETWTGRQLAGGVIYELHVGTFTPEGTLRAAIDRLDHLVRLGIDFVELMPVNAFNGRHNWGYDGVQWYAVHDGYGGPTGLPGVRRRLPRPRARGDPGRGLQPPGAERELPARVWALPVERRAQHLGLLAQPGRRGLRRGTPLHHRQRLDVPHRLPRRRAAARRRARAARHPSGAPARGAEHRGLRPERLPTADRCR